MVSILLALTLSATQFQFYRNMCVDWPLAPWNPLAGVPTVQGFCGPPDGNNIPFTMTIDGKFVDTTPARLGSFTSLAYGIDKPDLGYVTYVTSHEYVVTPGTHTIVVKYGTKTVTFQVIGAVCDPALAGVSFATIPKRPWVRGTSLVDCRQ